MSSNDELNKSQISIYHSILYNFKKTYVRMFENKEELNETEEQSREIVHYSCPSCT
jgi:hypothetical protein